MSDFTDKVTKVVNELQVFARKHGWSEYIYSPYHPLIITDLDLMRKGYNEHTKKDSRTGY